MSLDCRTKDRRSASTNYDAHHKMAGCKDKSFVRDKQIVDDAEGVKKILTVVVKRRKIIPTKCMELLKQLATNELTALENSKVILKESKEKEDFKKNVHGLQKFRSFQFSLDDLHDAEKKLQTYHKKTKEVNIYLEKKKNVPSNYKNL